MPETSSIESAELAESARASNTPNKACDNCRKKKIRCDRTTPCSNCRRAHVLCTKSARVARAKRRHIATTSQYEDKIDLIDSRLDRMSRVIDTLVPGDASCQMTSNLASPNPSLASGPIHSSSPPDAQANRTARASLPAVSPGIDKSQDGNRPRGQPAARPNNVPAAGIVAEGQSSLSAHSTLAIDFLHKVVGRDRQRGHCFETSELLDSLHQITDAIKNQRQSPESLFTLSPTLATTSRKVPNMPPIQAAVAALRKAQDSRDISLVFLSELLHFQSLSDLCLKIYFSHDQSEAEFIIVNVALYYLYDDADEISTSGQLASCHDEYRSLCQSNLEKALSQLPLITRSSHDMALAMALGAIYAVEVSKPYMAWILVGTAYQMSYSLGFHTRARGADKGSDIPNAYGRLFWVIYFLEKSLCLRVGRFSAISDYEITVPLPGNTPAMDYCCSSVKLANLAGKTYERLYSLHALSLSDDIRRRNAQELSKELCSIQEQSRSATQAWLLSGVDQSRHDLIEFISQSDEVLWHSMQTLIQRAVPVPPDSVSSFTGECITSARAALEHHQLSVPALATGGPALVSSYMNWIILFSPFIPFIVLFCHVLETGDVKDLERMQAFVDSIEPACQRSIVISKHHRLFQVFHDVALRYTELKTASTPLQDGAADAVTEMDAYLNMLGFQLQATPNFVNGQHNFPLSSSMAPQITLPLQLHPGASEGSNVPESASQIANWYHVSQQMMGLLDSNEFPL